MSLTDWSGVWGSSLLFAVPAVTGGGMEENSIWYSALYEWKQNSEGPYPRTSWPQLLEDLDSGDPFPSERIADRFLEAVVARAGLEPDGDGRVRDQLLTGSDVGLALVAASERGTAVWAEAFAAVWMRASGRNTLSWVHIPEGHGCRVAAAEAVAGCVRDLGGSVNLFWVWVTLAGRLGHTTDDSPVGDRKLRDRLLGCVSLTGRDLSLSERDRMFSVVPEPLSYDPMNPCVTLSMLAPFSEGELERLCRSWVPGVAETVFRHHLPWGLLESRVSGLLESRVSGLLGDWAALVAGGDVPEVLVDSLVRVVDGYRAAGLVDSGDGLDVLVTTDRDRWDMYRLGLLDYHTDEREAAHRWLPGLADRWVPAGSGASAALLELVTETYDMAEDSESEVERQYLLEDFQHLGAVFRNCEPGWLRLVAEEEKRRWVRWSERRSGGGSVRPLGDWTGGSVWRWLRLWCADTRSLPVNDMIGVLPAQQMLCRYPEVVRSWTERNFPGLLQNPQKVFSTVQARPDIAWSTAVALLQ